MFVESEQSSPALFVEGSGHMVRESFGERLKKYRKNSGLTQENLIQKLSELDERYLGYEHSIISNWERGKRPPPDRETIVNLAQALQLTDIGADDLLLSAQCSPLDYEHRLKLVRKTSNELGSMARSIDGIRRTIEDFLAEGRARFEEITGGPDIEEAVTSVVDSNDDRRITPSSLMPKEVRELYVKLSARYGIQFHKVIADPIWGTIPFTKLEARIINTPEFRRLCNIGLLGVTSLIYPIAGEPVFNHCLGTLTAAQRIACAINDNPASETIISADDMVLLRVSALLQNITAIPFRQDLEDEGGILPGYGHVRRLERLLHANSAIGRLLISYGGYPFYKSCIDIVGAGKQDLLTLEKPYIADILKNGISAELLDHLSRDVYFTGIHQAWDQRLLQHFVISAGDSTHPNRVVLRLFRKGEMLRHVVGELLNLLRLHVVITERLHFHGQSTRISAMVIEATQAAILHDPSTFSEASFCARSYHDGQLMVTLKNSGGQIAERIMQRLEPRLLYRPILTIKPDNSMIAEHQFLEVRRKLAGHAITRFEEARRLEKVLGLPMGSVIIYCPRAESGLEGLSTLVEWEGEIRELRDIPDCDVNDEITGLIQNVLSLRQICVFLDPEIAQDSRVVADLAQQSLILLRSLEV